MVENNQCSRLNHVLQHISQRVEGEGSLFLVVPSVSALILNCNGSLFQVRVANNL